MVFSLQRIGPAERSLRLPPISLTLLHPSLTKVCNNGLVAGALAIANEDPTGIAARVLEYAVANAAENCAMSPSNDGTWSETANYWYFGTTGHVQMASALLSATGSTQNLLDSNPGMKLSGLYHMWVGALLFLIRNLAACHAASTGARSR